MFFYHEGQTLYLKAWSYNMALVLKELEDLVKLTGGRVKPATKGFIEYQKEDRENSRRKVSHISSLPFVLDDIYYYVEFDDNPFFFHYFTKLRITNGKVARTPYSSNIEDTVPLDGHLLNYGCDKEIILKTAKDVFEALVNAPLSRVDMEKKRKTVPNTYDGGIHYEWVYEKPPLTVVDF